MGLKYKIDVIQALKDKGYSTYKLRKDKLIGESTLTKLRNDEGVAWDVIETLCGLLQCQPSDFLVYKSDDDEEAQ